MFAWLRTRPRDWLDPETFKHLSLTALLAWIGLGADGISSACYGPAEAYVAFGANGSFGLIFIVLCIATIAIISASYLQIIRAFPAGGGAYVVVSKQLSPELGMVAGCALTIDYVMTVTVSIASGMDALFSFLPLSYQSWKLTTECVALVAMALLNLRGIKESVIPLVPIVLGFLLTHIVAIVVTLAQNTQVCLALPATLSTQWGTTVSSIGTIGAIIAILHAYSVGGGTFTGIEAVSNGLPYLREPRVRTATRTMYAMAISLSLLAGGLMLGYVLINARLAPGQTLNAVLLNATGLGKTFTITALVFEALILVVAAQTGFLGGPNVLANMARDAWVPNKFALLSDNLVKQNGVIGIGISSLILLLVARGNVSFLLVLYSINVFLTFSLSQLGMLNFWWTRRIFEPKWKSRWLINGCGFVCTTFILVSMVYLKVGEGGWLTLSITGACIVCCYYTRRYYQRTGKCIQKFDVMYQAFKKAPKIVEQNLAVASERTAILLVGGYSGLGLHAFVSIRKLFGDHFKNMIFMQIGLIDSGQFKGVDEIENLKNKVENDLKQYVAVAASYGYNTESVYSLGTDVATESEKLAEQLMKRFPQSVCFVGHVLFKRENIISHFLHNYTAQTVQKRLYQLGMPVFTLPIRVEEN